MSLFKIISSGWIGDRPLRLASVRAGSGRYPDCDGSRGLIRGNYHLARRGKWDARILEEGRERERAVTLAATGPLPRDVCYGPELFPLAA